MYPVTLRSDGKRPNDHIPKLTSPPSSASTARKNGGKPLTHYTSKCKKYIPNGSVKNDFGKGGMGSSNRGKDSKRKKAHFVQMKQEYRAWHAK
jgi:hypothetical protein